jgi:integrase
LGPNTIDSYRLAVIGKPDAKPRSQPAVSLLAWWGDRPIVATTLPELLDWYDREVRDGAGGTRPPSASVRNTRRSAASNFFAWLSQVKRLQVDPEILDYLPAYEDRASGRRKDVSLNPIADGVFRAIWLSQFSIDDRLWIGMSAFMTMRAGEVANIRPDQVDLERQSATFGAKGGALRTVHYGQLCKKDWPMLPHLDDTFEQWMKLFEGHAERCQEDQRKDPDLRWLCPSTIGASRPHRDRKSEVVWYATKRDMNRFDKGWQRALRAAGFAARSHNPHQLRHFAATNLWRSGASWDRIKSEMGHDAEATTRGYLHFNPAFDRERKPERAAPR